MHLISPITYGPITYQELIQNADDAGASAVAFIYDERNYGTDSLWTKDLGKYQGICVETLGADLKGSHHSLKMISEPATGYYPLGVLFPSSLCRCVTTMRISGVLQRLFCFINGKGM